VIDSEADAIWVISDLASDEQTYIPVVHYGKDVAFPLIGDKAIAYATTVFRAAETAEYDEAVFRQLLKILGEDKIHLLASLMIELRASRQPLDNETTAPFAFEPFVSGITRKGGVYLSLHGERLAQWSVADAREHAGFVMQIHCGVDLDAGYCKLLTGSVGLDIATARRVVQDLLSNRKD
jgi:hypothetical protein